MAGNDPEALLRRIGRRVAELRVDKDWTQAGLAEALGVSTPYVASIESGRENLTIRSLCKLADAFEAPMKTLLRAPKRTTPPKRGRPRTPVSKK